MKSERKEYVGYSREEFETKLLGISLLLGLDPFEDVTEELNNLGFKMWEKVYGITFDNLKIRIYSTIDIRTDRTREIGQDTVKVLLIQESSGVESYQRIGKHIRIHTLFDNLKKSLENIIRGNFCCEFSSDLLKVLR